MQALTCRRATVADVEKLLPLVEQFYGHFGFPWDTARKRSLLTGFLTRPELGQLWIAQQGEDLAGYASVPFYFALEYDGSVGLLDEFFTLPELRGRGVGAHLLAAVTEGLKQDRISRLRLEVDDRHPQAASLYERLGFKRDGRQTWSRPVC